MIRRNRYAVRAAMAVADAILIALSYCFALWAKYDFRLGRIPDGYLAALKSAVPFAILISLLLFILLKMYQYVWSAVGLRDVMTMAVSVVAAFVVCAAVFAIAGLSVPSGVMFIAFVLQLVLLIGMRVSLRVFRGLRVMFREAGKKERILLIGGGSAGSAILREMMTLHRSDSVVCAVIDDNPTKKGKMLEGVRIYGGRDKIPECVQRKHITQILLAIPSLPPEEKRKILKICGETGIPTKSVPGIYQLVSGKARVTDVAEIRIEDLLERDSIQLELHSLKEELSGTVMVTGGGGSIGSELCRQIASYHPRRLVIVDIYENNAYEIQQELIRTYGDSLALSTEIASIRDEVKVNQLFEKYRPEIVFHAAAHKHVPLMENTPGEAIKNNIFGTYHVACAAEKYGARKFVMISTDKAVNPTNVMGATKRFCEMIMQSRKDCKTEYCAVRFGNVLGSNGSVVPLFRKQIAAGGPVTVTDKRITRFFMTIPEAVQLVLEAGSMAKQGQIFVLDMGQPVKILTLAENLIRLSGFEPYTDIDIIETGLRPGEKLYEELLMKSHDLAATKNRKIFVEQQGSIDPNELEEKLAALQAAIDRQSSDEEYIALLKSMIPTYHSPEEVNSASQG